MTLSQLVAKDTIGALAYTITVFSVGGLWGLGIGMGVFQRRFKSRPVKKAT